MIQEVISTQAPKAIGSYSQAVVVGDLIFCSGQIAINPVTGQLNDGYIKDQTKQVLENLKSVLKAAGGDIATVLKTTVYLVNMDDFTEMNSVYETFFKKPYPARSTVQVVKLPKNASIEIDCIALVNNNKRHCSKSCGCHNS